MNKLAPNEVYISYSESEKDKDLLRKLTDHLSTLENEGVITVWHEGKINAGEERAKEIKDHLNSADVILLLLSSDFLASTEHWKRDVILAMERHEKREARVIPVLLRVCDWEEQASFSKLKLLPSNKKAINSWNDEDEAFTDVTKGIRKAVQEISGQKKSDSKNQWLFNIPLRNLLTLLIASMGVSVLVIIIRLGGILQSLELAAYDQLMSFQLSYFPQEQQDKKLLIIKITKEEAAQEEEKASKSGGKNGTLTDASLDLLLEKLEENSPLAIGLDLYRNYPSRDKSKLKGLLLTNKNIFALCKAPQTEDSHDNGISPPPEISLERVGFSDLVQQKEVILRRQLLSIFKDNLKYGGCQSKKAFNLELARSYLAFTGKKGRNQEAFDSDGNLQDLIINGVVLEQLKIPHTGGYRGIDFTGYQILLDYRSFCQDGNNCSPSNVAKTFSLQQVLKDNLLKKEDVKGRIVLIGVEDNSYASDYVHTPNQQDMPGFIVQAQMLSYLLRIALGEQRQLRVWSLGYETLWILAWSLVGGILAQLYKSPRSLILSGVVALSSLCVVCSIFFSSPIKLWVPLVPSALTFLGTGGVVVFISFRIR